MLLYSQFFEMRVVHPHPLDFFIYLIIDHFDYIEFNCILIKIKVEKDYNHHDWCQKCISHFGSNHYNLKKKLHTITVNFIVMITNKLLKFSISTIEPFSHF